jgi:hypothetical protein
MKNIVDCLWKHYNDIMNWSMNLKNKKSFNFNHNYWNNQFFNLAKIKLGTYVLSIISKKAQVTLWQISWINHWNYMSSIDFCKIENLSCAFSLLNFGY